MHITTPLGLTRDPAHPLRFAGNRGERLQLDVLEHDLIRVRHLPDGTPRLDRTWLVVDETGTTPRAGRLRDDLFSFSQPAYTLDDTRDHLLLATDALRLRVYSGDDFRLEWETADGLPFAADLPHRAYAYDSGGQTVFHYLRHHPDEHYYGFGEKAGALNKAGTRMRMVNMDALGYNAETSDPLYKHFPFYITYVPTLNLAYGLFYDNLATTTFDMGREISAFWGSYRVYQADAGDLDYYLLYGPTIENLVEKFTRLTGRPALPPRWSLGYLGSTMSYTEAPDAQAQLARFVELCRQHNIPCSMFHLSSGYTTDTAGRRNVFTWNTRRVPDPPAMVNTFHQAGIRLAANIKPYLLTTHPDYEQVKGAGGLLPVTSRFWSGGLNEAADGAYLDFTSEAGYRWWQAGIRESLLNVGIDAVWNDNNEFEVWEDDARCDGFGNPFYMAHARPLQTLLMGRASYETLQAARPNLRPFVLTRAGCPGINRYAQTWTGDNATSWHTLRWNIPMGLNMGLSGLANIGHDVGGFFGPAPDPELFVRWVQNGVFHPRFAIHSWNTDGTVNEPWMHPEVLPIVREWIKFRYRLQPYLYTLMWEAHQAGHPLVRPLVYHHADDPRTHTESFDFLLGSHLLVTSVLEPGARTRSVYLPAGAWWADFYTGEWHAGGQTITADAPLERIPLFVRDGGLIPMWGEGENTRVAFAFVREHDAIGTLIEDDGETLDYTRGGYTELRLHMRAGQDEQPEVEVIHSGYSLPYSEIAFVVNRKAAITVPVG